MTGDLRLICASSNPCLADAPLVSARALTQQMPTPRSFAPGTRVEMAWWIRRSFGRRSRP